MIQFEVQLGMRGYPIYIGAGLLGEPRYLKEHIRGSRVFVLSNERVAPLYLEAVCQQLEPNRVLHLALADGEATKSLQTVEQVYTCLLENRCGRDTTLVALGGGVIGDITGFVAATYLRGVDFIQIPTTLLAQVDSSVGGKTGVNHALGKNMIGAFYQPQCVIADLECLRTLEDRELRAGIAEIIKYGLIRDAEFFVWLEDNVEHLLARDTEALTYAVHRSCKNKAEVVAEDELEISGARALLNLGHTFGHAIETALGYGQWLHGEAVACGMLMAARMSIRLGWLNEEAGERIQALLARAQLPSAPPEALQAESFLEHMARDKKARADQLHLVLLRDIGKAVLTGEFPASALKDTLQEFCGT
ncbi:MAG: 3-dehydroquinate synthase [Gammaproteobacteria bacterium]|nr:3-dehydroquinate synthase [Gammaproteobacteria bacterium]